MGNTVAQCVFGFAFRSAMLVNVVMSIQINIRLCQRNVRNDICGQQIDIIRNQVIPMLI